MQAPFARTVNPLHRFEHGHEHASAFGLGDNVADDVLSAVDVALTGFLCGQLWHALHAAARQRARVTLTVAIACLLAFVLSALPTVIPLRRLPSLLRAPVLSVSAPHRCFRAAGLARALRASPPPSAPRLGDTLARALLWPTLHHSLPHAAFGLAALASRAAAFEARAPRGALLVALPVLSLLVSAAYAALSYAARAVAPGLAWSPAACAEPGVVPVVLSMGVVMRAHRHLHVRWRSRSRRARTFTPVDQVFAPPLPVPLPLPALLIELGVAVVAAPDVPAAAAAVAGTLVGVALAIVLTVSVAVRRIVMRYWRRHVRRAMARQGAKPVVPSETGESAESDEVSQSQTDGEPKTDAAVPANNEKADRKSSLRAQGQSANAGQQARLGVRAGSNRWGEARRTALRRLAVRRAASRVAAAQARARVRARQGDGEVPVAAEDEENMRAQRRWERLVRRADESAEERECRGVRTKKEL